MMTKLLFLPLFLHVLMVLWLGLRTLSARVKAVRNGSAKLSEIATDSGAWPRKVRQLSQNFDNQFDSPMLWYAAIAIILAMNLVDFSICWAVLDVSVHTHRP